MMVGIVEDFLYSKSDFLTNNELAVLSLSNALLTSVVKRMYDMHRCMVNGKTIAVVEVCIIVNLYYFSRAN